MVNTIASLMFITSLYDFERTLPSGWGGEVAVKPALSDVFSGSPLQMLERHANACSDCVHKLIPYFEAAQANEWQRAAELRGSISRLESIADDLKLDVRLNLPRGLWMSVSRADLLELVRMQDTMANIAKDVVGLSMGRQLAFPSKMEKGLFKYLASVVDCVEKAVEVVNEVRELSRTGFGIRQAKKIVSKVTSVEKVERKSDEQQANLKGKLRSYETEISPIDAMFLYQLLSDIGEIADSAEKVSHRAQIIASS